MPTMRRVTKATELKRFKELEGEYHYMGEIHSGGDTMRLVFEENGKWAALTVWGSACYHLKPRDAYAGWTNSIRAERLKLVVNKRRFTILSGPGERRNLASECLGLVAQELPRLWLKKFRYRPLLAETFCNIERTARTCYKAAGYESLYDALRHVHDTRDSNRAFPIGGILAIVVMAMMSGASSVKAVARFSF